MKQVSKEFDQFASRYRSILDDCCKLTGESSEYFAKLKVQKLVEWFPRFAQEKKAILDFGCGDGMMTHFLAQQFTGAQICGVDPSPKSIAIADARYPEISFSVNSDTSTKLDFQDAQFNLIVSAGAFHHIPYHMHQGYLKELFRILKKSGHLILFELNPLNPGTVLMFNRSPYEENARMLLPWYTYKLCKPFGGCSIKYYCFFPRFLKLARPLEPWLSKMPFGGLYAAIMEKTS